MRVVRNETKFYINYLDYKTISGLLSRVLTKDENCVSSEGYYIKSLYFDNVDDEAFHEKIDGVDKRMKYRLRIYNCDDKFIKFEIKNKLNNYMYKDTALVKMKDAQAIQQGDYEVLLDYDDPVLNKIYYNFKCDHYRPVVVNHFLRDAYCYDLNNIRITFDKYLEKDIVGLDIFDRNLSMGRIFPDEVIIMEIKYHHFIPEWLKPILQIPSFEKCAISKYCMSRMERVDLG